MGKDQLLYGFRDRDCIEADIFRASGVAMLQGGNRIRQSDSKI